MNGTWKSQSSWDGMAEGTVSIAPFTNMPEDVAKMAGEDIGGDQVWKSFIPSPDRSPSRMARSVGEAGKPLADGDILGMNWYVKGIDDKLPQ